MICRKNGPGNSLYQKAFGIELYIKNDRQAYASSASLYVLIGLIKQASIW